MIGSNMVHSVAISSLIMYDPIFLPGPNRWKHPWQSWTLTSKKLSVHRLLTNKNTKSNGAAEQRLYDALRQQRQNPFRLNQHKVAKQRYSRTVATTMAKTKSVEQCRDPKELWVRTITPTRASRILQQPKGSACASRKSATMHGPSVDTPPAMR